MGEVWYKMFCSCGKKNWVCNGDEEDCTVGDVEVFKCWSCGIVNPIDKGFMEDEWEMFYKDEDSEYKIFQEYLENGVKLINGLEKLG